MIRPTWHIRYSGLHPSLHLSLNSLAGVSFLLPPTLSSLVVFGNRCWAVSLAQISISISWIPFPRLILGSSLDFPLGIGFFWGVWQVNDQLKQNGSTSDMIFKIPVLIEHVSSIMSLEVSFVFLPCFRPTLPTACVAEWFERHHRCTQFLHLPPGLIANLFRSSRQVM